MRYYIVMEHKTSKEERYFSELRLEKDKDMSGIKVSNYLRDSVSFSTLAEAQALILILQSMTWNGHLYTYGVSPKGAM